MKPSSVIVTHLFRSLFKELTFSGEPCSGPPHSKYLLSADQGNECESQEHFLSTLFPLHNNGIAVQQQVQLKTNTKQEKRYSHSSIKNN